MKTTDRHCYLNYSWRCDITTFDIHEKKVTGVIWVRESRWVRGHDLHNWKPNKTSTEGERKARWNKRLSSYFRSLPCFEQYQFTKQKTQDQLFRSPRMLHWWSSLYILDMNVACTGCSDEAHSRRHLGGTFIGCAPSSLRLWPFLLHQIPSLSPVFETLGSEQ